VTLTKLGDIDPPKTGRVGKYGVCLTPYLKATIDLRPPNTFGLM